MKKLHLLGAVCAFLLSTPLYAAVVLDFGTGLAGSGGTIDDVEGNGTHIIGTNINIGSFEAVGTTADDVYVVTDGLLNFDTDLNTVTIDGIIYGLGINSSITLLSGSFNFNGWDYDDFGTIVNFNGAGVDSEQPPAKAGGFGLRLKAGSIGPSADYRRYTTVKSSSGSGGC